MRRLRRRVPRVCPGARPDPNGAQSTLTTDSGVVDTPSTGGRSVAGASTVGSAPRNPVSATTAS